MIAASSDRHEGYAKARFLENSRAQNPHWTRCPSYSCTDGDVSISIYSFVLYISDVNNKYRFQEYQCLAIGLCQENEQMTRFVEIVPTMSIQL